MHKIFLGQNIDKINYYWTKRARALVNSNFLILLETDKKAKEGLSKIAKFNLKIKKANDNLIIPKSYFLITSFIPEWLLAFPEHIGQIALLTEKIFSNKQNFNTKGHINAKNIAINDLELRIGPWMKTCKTLLNHGFNKQLNYILCNLMDSISSKRIKVESLTSREYVSIINLCSYLNSNSNPANQLMNIMISKFTKLAHNMGNFDIITSLSAFSRFKIICNIEWVILRNLLTPFLNKMSILELGILLDSIGQFRVQDKNFFEKVKNSIPMDDYDVTGMAILLKSLVRLDSPRIMDMGLIYDTLKRLDISNASSRYLTTINLSLGFILSQSINLDLFKIFLRILKKIELMKLDYKDSTKILIAIMSVWAPPYQFPLKYLKCLKQIITSNPIDYNTIGFSKSDKLEFKLTIKELEETLNTNLSLNYAGPYALYVVPQ